MIHAAEPQTAAGAKPKILVHITHGPEQPTRAALGFLVARTAIEQGHVVSIFLAGDAQPADEILGYDHRGLPN